MISRNNEILSRIYEFISRNNEIESCSISGYYEFISNNNEIKVDITR